MFVHRSGGGGSSAVRRLRARENQERDRHRCAELLQSGQRRFHRRNQVQKYMTVITGYCSPGGSVAVWLACWTQAQKGLGLNRSRDAVG